MAEGGKAGELTIWGRLNAYNVQKVVWAAEEVGCGYRRIDAGRAYGVTDTPEYLQMNPNGRVPAIRDGDFTLWESNVIVRYLAARYAPGRLCPEPLRARMEAEKWMDWEATDIFRGFLPCHNVIIRHGDRYTAEEADASFAETCGRLEILDARLAKTPFVAGDTFTMGDIPIGILTNYLVRTGRDMGGLAHLKRWHTALTSRPAMRTAMAVEWGK